MGQTGPRLRQRKPLAEMAEKTRYTATWKKSCLAGTMTSPTLCYSSSSSTTCHTLLSKSFVQHLLEAADYSGGSETGQWVV